MIAQRPLFDLSIFKMHKSSIAIRDCVSECTEPVETKMIQEAVYTKVSRTA